ncbi:MAG TPA: hypothetical protein VD833_02750 [Vicinamibacterales bacterium]|nr:hypothetical protein [Vicinamibacterales bacterium]
METNGDDLDRHVRRWLAAEEQNRDDDADAEFRKVFAAASAVAPPSPSFVNETMTAVQAVAARDRRLARLTRVAVLGMGVSGAGVLTWFSAGLIVSAMSTALTAFLDLTIGLIVGAATSGQPGTTVWSIFANLGRAAAAFAASPTVTLTILVIQALAIAALAALQRILGSDLESSR